MIKSCLAFLTAAVLPLAAQTCSLPGPAQITNAVEGAAFREFGFSAGSFLTIFGLNFQVPDGDKPAGAPTMQR